VSERHRERDEAKSEAKIAKVRKTRDVERQGLEPTLHTESTGSRKVREREKPKKVRVLRCVFGCLFVRPHHTDH